MRYVVSCVGSNLHSYSAPVTAVMCTISCSIGSCYNSIQLYMPTTPCPSNLSLGCLAGTKWHWMPYCWWVFFFFYFHLICLHLGFRSFCHFSHLSLPRLFFCWVSSLYGLLWHYTVWYSMAVLKIELRSPSLPCLWFQLTIQIETAQLWCHVQNMVAITMLEFDWDENEISV